MTKKVNNFKYGDGLIGKFWSRNLNIPDHCCAKGANLYFLLFPSLAGIFIGATIATRTSELIWLLPSLFFLWLVNIKKVNFFKILIVVLFVIFSLLPVFHYNQTLYSSPYLGGYAEMNKSIIAIKDAGSDFVKSTIESSGNLFNLKQTLKILKKSLFPFGILPKQSLEMFDIYFIKMFAPIFYLGVLGFVLFAARAKRWKFGHFAFLISYFIGSLILIVYYGSWEFHDNPDPNSHTIGNSYTRYWLPIYLGFIPFAATAIIRLSRMIFTSQIFKNEKTEKFWSFRINYKFLAVSSQALIVAIIFINSINFVLAGSEEGLIYNIVKQEKSRHEWEVVIGLTESNSVIVTRYHDKLFFPERKVIVGLFDDNNMVKEYANLTALLPVYYYNFTLPEKDIEYLNKRRLAEFGLNIREVKKVTESFTLYKLNLNPASGEVKPSMSAH